MDGGGSGPWDQDDVAKALGKKDQLKMAVGMDLKDVRSNGKVSVISMLPEFDLSSL